MIALSALGSALHVVLHLIICSSHNRHHVSTPIRPLQENPGY